MGKNDTNITEDISPQYVYYLHFVFLIFHTKIYFILIILFMKKYFSILSNKDTNTSVHICLAEKVPLIHIYHLII